MISIGLWPIAGTNSPNRDENAATLAENADAPPHDAFEAINALRSGNL